MANLSTIYNSGSIYEQLISQVIAVESQPKLKLTTEKSDQNVYKGVLSDFSSKVSTLDKLVDKLRDPLQDAFVGKGTSVGSGAGFTATAGDDAVLGKHEIRVTQLARADARFSTQLASSGGTLAAQFGGTTASFTIHVAQPEGDPVGIDVSYAIAADATDDQVLSGLSAAIASATQAAEAEGLLAEGTGVAASVVHETAGTSRLSLRGEATGYANRLTFSDPDGLLSALEVDRTDVRSGTGGGAVIAVGTGAEDSGLSASFTLDGLALYRDTNTVEDALDGVTLKLTKPTDDPVSLEVTADVKGMKAQVESFVKAYNGLVSFLTTKTKVNADTGARGTFAGDAGVRGLRAGLRTDLVRQVDGAGAIGSLTDLGITTERDGTLTISDTETLDAALKASPADVGALFSADGGLADRISTRLDGLLGTKGVIAQRKASADARITRLADQIKRWDSRLSLREESLRAQFNQLQEIASQAQTQQSTLAFYYYA